MCRTLQGYIRFSVFFLLSKQLVLPGLNVLSSQFVGLLQLTAPALGPPLHLTGISGVASFPYDCPQPILLAPLGLASEIYTISIF